MKPVRLEVSDAGVTLSRGRQRIVIPAKQACEIALTLLLKVDPEHPDKFVRVY